MIPSSRTEYPNILVIMTDQHHAGCLGLQGHPDVQTPNLDRLAAAGVRFNNCFAQNGVCVPSRVSYLTGMYCHSHGVYGNDNDRIPSHLLSLPHYLQAFGYQTAIVGKKHLPGWRTDGFQHQRVCYHSDAGLRAHDYYNYLKKHNLHHLYDDLGDVEKFCLSELPAVPLQHSLEVWTGDETLSYLQQADRERPFFLMTSFERPHPPLTVPEGCPFVYDPDKLTLPPNQEEVIQTSPFYFNRNVELKWCRSHHGEAMLRQGLAAYYALISLIDQQVGRIFAGLEKLGLRENTLVLFCSDHGDYAGEYSKMAKGWNYDAIHRVPFVWHWPGHLPQGQVKDGLVETIDVFPTVCRLLDVPVPKSVQGRDLSECLLQPLDSDREAVFYEFIGVKTIRTRTHKLSYAYDGEQELGELFDLISDPHEYVNLFDVAEFAPIREELLRKLLNWSISTEQPSVWAPGNEKLPSTRWFENHDNITVSWEHEAPSSGR